MSGPAARVAAQAKVNLALRVLARERSGYHQLETLFARLELADDVVVRVRGRGASLDVAGPACPPEGLGPAERNLAYRAAAAFAQAAGWPSGFAVEIEKRIPVGGGLGGGSADAGAVLRALNALAPRPLPAEALLRLAGSLGADVPYLTTDSALALAWGRGERVLALPALPQRLVALVIPPFGVSTREAFGWLAAAGQPASEPPPAALDADQLRSWDGVAALSANDLEPVVFARHPALREVLRSLATTGARIARMTGSGSTLFGVFDTPPSVPPQLPVSAAGAPWRVVQTRTAARVVSVERID